MNRISILLILIVMLAMGIAYAGENTNTQFSVGTNKKILDRGRTAIPIEISNVNSLRAFSVVVKYDGNLLDIEFVPSDYLHEPIMLPLRIDFENKVVEIVVSSTNNVIARKDEGVLGELIFGAQSIPNSIEVVEALAVDENYHIDAITTANNYLNESKLDIEDGRDESVPALVTRIDQNYPNPANPVTTISFSIREDCQVSLNIFNVNGQLIKNLINEKLSARRHSVVWDGLDANGNTAASGIYFYKFIAGNYSETKKVILLR